MTRGHLKDRIIFMSDDEFEDFSDMVEEYFSEIDNRQLSANFQKLFLESNDPKDLVKAVEYFLKAEGCSTYSSEIQLDNFWVFVEYTKPHNKGTRSYSFYNWKGFIEKYI